MATLQSNDGLRVLNLTPYGQDTSREEWMLVHLKLKNNQTSFETCGEILMRREIDTMVEQIGKLCEKKSTSIYFGALEPNFDISLRLLNEKNSEFCVRYSEGSLPPPGASATGETFHKLTFVVTLRQLAAFAEDLRRELSEVKGL